MAWLTERSDLPQTVDENRLRAPPQREAPRLFEHVERALAVGIGILLSLAAVLALTGAATLAWDGAVQWPHTRSLFGIVERLLFVPYAGGDPAHGAGVDSVTRANVRAVFNCWNNRDHSPDSGGYSGNLRPAALASMSSFNNVLGLLTLVLAVAIYLSRRSKA